jgi:hypothetical protein
VDNDVKGIYVMEFPHGFWWNFSFNMAQGGRFAYYYPDRPPREELRDYAFGYYGPIAGPLMFEYHQMLADNLEISYRAAGGDATEGDLNWLADQRKLLERAAFLAQDDPVVSYRLKKLLGALEIATLWGGGRRFQKAAQAAFEKFEKREATKKEVEVAVVAAREYLDKLLLRAAEVESAYPGVTQSEWIKSWWTDRTVKGELDAIEKKLQGLKPAEKSKKPAHVAGTAE